MRASFAIAAVLATVAVALPAPSPDVSTPDQYSARILWQRHESKRDEMTKRCTGARDLNTPDDFSNCREWKRDEEELQKRCGLSVGGNTADGFSACEGLWRRQKEEDAASGPTSVDYQSGRAVW